MKRKIFILILLSMICIGASAQSVDKAEVKKQVEAITDTLTEEQKDFLSQLLEDILIEKVDSALDEGRYMGALEIIETMQENWKYVTGRDMSPWVYLKKSNILMHLEEWRDIIKTTEECFSIHKEKVPDKYAVILYNQQGMAHRILKEYREAIRSYELELSYCTKTEDLGGQGSSLCDMAYCYSQIDKQMMASDLYKKGLDKYLEYFGTTRSSLLRWDFSPTDSYKKIVLDVFSGHLYNMAIYEQDYGSRRESKDYLLMSAHCGNDMAESEYQRIYGKSR